MRLQTDNWSIDGACKIGHRHKSLSLNCQDYLSFSANTTPPLEYDNCDQSFVVIPPREILIGVICDGCSEGAASEVGAVTLSQFISDELHHLLCYRGLDVKVAIEVAFIHATDYILKNVLAFFTDDRQSNNNYSLYIKNQWLCTVLGFVLIDGDCSVFSAGDGVVAYNDETISISQNNTPTYIAYNVLQKLAFGSVPDQFVPKKFEILNLGKVDRVMIASDGFETHNKNLLFVHNENLSETALRGQQWSKTGQFGLKKWVNACSQKGYFDDDVSLITAERKK